MYVGEESHRGVVPMNSSNKDGTSSAEKGEGRLRHKENPHLPRTHPTQCGICVSPRFVGGGPFGRDHPSEEPYALTSARTDLCGGCWVTSIPTATATHDDLAPKGRTNEAQASGLGLDDRKIPTQP